MRELNVFSIFLSIQGESTKAGLPCTFIRLAGCPVGCAFCDTKEAQREDAGTSMTIESIVQATLAHGVDLVQVTGGEPLAQESTAELLGALCDSGCEVMLETSGAFPISGIDERVHVVLDVKTPGSGVNDKMVWPAVFCMAKRRGELKFVITSHEDFEWALNFVKEHALLGKVEILFSAATPFVEPVELASWIRDCKEAVRFQIQLHKILWPGESER